MVAKNNAQKAVTWLERLALDGIIVKMQRLEVQGGILTWNRIFGAILIVLLMLLFISGCFMALYYSPVPGTAYDSVDYALFSLPVGGIIKGIHHYAWNILLIVMGLHLLHTFFVGAYKAPRQMVWVSGMLVLLLIPLFIITGDLLPWDQKGYWSTQVRLSIIDTVPAIGELLVRMLQGGPLTGIVALTRFYILHILFLPCALVILLAIHFQFIHYHGLSEPLYARTFRSKVPFFPVMLNRLLVLFIALTIILALISYYWPPPLGDPADPTDTNYIPRPEWWVLFLNQLVSIFKGPLTVLGSTIIPGLLALVVMILPFLDHSQTRHPRHRKTVFTIMSGILVVILVLSFMGYIEHFGHTPMK